jgi:hypothetical protein
VKVVFYGVIGRWPKGYKEAGSLFFGRITARSGELVYKRYVWVDIGAKLPLHATLM